MVEMINIGFNFMVPKNRILGIKETGSSPIKRLIKQANEEGRAVNATHGRKTKSVILMDNGSIFLSAISAPTLAGRMQDDYILKTGTENYKE